MNQGVKVNNRLLVSCIILILVGHYNVSAQAGYSFLSFEEVYLADPDSLPTLSTQIHTYFPIISYSPELNQVYVLENKTLFEIDLNTKEWYQTDFESIPAENPQIRYSTFHNSLLFWDDGVGRVFGMDTTKTFTRLDNSFNHRSQSRHLGWIDQETGSIYALGGYGLFEYKTHLLRFNPSSGIWELVDYINPLNGPAMLVGRIAALDYVNQLLYVFSNDMTIENHNTRKERSDAAAVWSYSISSRTWNKIYSFYGLINTNTPNILSLVLNSMHSRLPVFMFPLHAEDIIHYPICIFHTENHFVRCFEENQFNKKLNFRVLTMFWSERDQAYYFVGLKTKSYAQRQLIHIVKMTITDEQAFMQWVEEKEQPWYQSTAWWMTFGLVSLGLVVFGVYYGRRNKGHSERPTIHSRQHVISIVQTDSGEYELVGSRRTIQGLPYTEHKLLLMLVDSFTTPDLYLKSDEIDEKLLPNHPNQDYIRRLRNLTLERLEGLFRSAGDDSVNYILRRTTLADKRKNEYRLNKRYVRLSSEPGAVSSQQ
jgi:hypothetical protein